MLADPTTNVFQKVPLHQPLLTRAYINASCLSLFNRLGAPHAIINH